MHRQIARRWTRTAFFALFILAPPLDIFRLDLLQGHFIFFGLDWTLGLEPLAYGELSPLAATINIIVFAFLPLASVVGLGLWLSWKYGRLYCGWLCPHFSVVEMINSLMRRASGRPSVWEPSTLPQQESSGAVYKTDRRYWLPAGIAIIGFAFLWAVVLLTYLLPPALIYNNLISGELSRNQTIFISVGTLLLCLEFLLARHLFCRFGCAVGLFQSLVWMANDKALAIGFDRHRGEACKTCTQVCDNACPMRLKPRKNKRHMFTCTQCARCVDACESVQPAGKTLLHWQGGQTSQGQSDRQAPVHFNNKGGAWKKR